MNNLNNAVRLTSRTARGRLPLPLILLMTSFWLSGARANPVAAETGRLRREWVPLSKAFDASGELRFDLFSHSAVVGLARMSIHDISHDYQIPAECVSEHVTSHTVRADSLDSTAESAKWVFVGRIVSSEAGFLASGEAGTLFTVSVTERLRSPHNAGIAPTVFVFYRWVNARWENKYVCAREHGLPPPPTVGLAVVVLTRTSPLESRHILFSPGIGEVIPASADDGVLHYSPLHKAVHDAAPKRIRDFREWLNQHPERPAQETRQGRAKSS